MQIYQVKVQGQLYLRRQTIINFFCDNIEKTGWASEWIAKLLSLYYYIMSIYLIEVRHSWDVHALLLGVYTEIIL